MHLQSYLMSLAEASCMLRLANWTVLDASAEFADMAMGRDLRLNHIAHVLADPTNLRTALKYTAPVSRSCTLPVPDQNLPFSISFPPKRLKKVIAFLFFFSFFPEARELHHHLESFTMSAGEISKRVQFSSDNLSAEMYQNRDGLECTDSEPLQERDALQKTAQSSTSTKDRRGGILIWRCDILQRTGFQG